MIAIRGTRSSSGSIGSKHIAGGRAWDSNDALAGLSFSHQRLQYELTQIVPLAVIIGVGVLFYFLGVTMYWFKIPFVAGVVSLSPSILPLVTAIHGQNRAL